MNKYGRDAASQIWLPKSQALATFGGGTGAPGTATFKCPVPDSRLRIKISLLFIPPAGQNPNTGLSTTGSIWLFGSDEDTSGVSGMTIPTSNVEGSRAAPSAIPAADGLLGYSREFVTAADYIEGVFTAAGGPAGTWVLQTRYQPDAVAFSVREWDEICPRCNPGLTSRAANVP